ncbi:hypothetical protein BBJ28_00009193 [Nothophytophthora sp. Chile5]|nr:hypothetical protein BBJ28_00009193 [Nothophytophthora sp. Chile5]
MLIYCFVGVMVSFTLNGVVLEKITTHCVLDEMSMAFVFCLFNSVVAVGWDARYTAGAVIQELNPWVMHLYATKRSNGGHELPKARHILQSLRANNVPHIFLTNGGGCMEEEKAKYLSNILELPINPKHMVLSHTPMREIAKSYGGAPAPHHEEPIEAIIVMHDPINWAPEIQVAVDVLIGGDPPGSGRLSGKQTPLFVSNDDFIFSGAYPFPRFAQGTELMDSFWLPLYISRAFTKCLKLLYEDLTGRKLEVTNYGKPHNVTYKCVPFVTHYAEDLLNSISGRSEPLKHIYGIGDNPLSDIQGANNAGEKWTSVLVRSGIYDGSKEPEHVPDVTVEGVYEAIQHIYEREGVDKSTL